MLEERLARGETRFAGEAIVVPDTVQFDILSNLVFTRCDLSRGSLEGKIFRNLRLVSSHCEHTRFARSAFEECRASRYAFSHCDFSNVRIADSDFSGGLFDHVTFDNAVFEETDFALGEFQSVSFRNARFSRCNLNASVFDDADFEGARFDQTTLEYVEGLDPSTMERLRKQGAAVSPPLEIAFRDALTAFWKRRSGMFRTLALALFFFAAGFYCRPAFRGGLRLFLLDANPLSAPLRSLLSSGRVSFFSYRLNLPNHDFSKDLEHWMRVMPHPALNGKRSGIEISHEHFFSFPAALLLDHYDGALYYSRTRRPEPSFTDPLDSPSVWIPVDPRGERLKLSFRYRRGHPKFSIFGRFLEGGRMILAEIQPRHTPESDEWSAYAEGIVVPPGMRSICLKLGQCPPDRIHLDDVNLETAI
jgi:uncharacterized protein YjbI with pentapeptide repeats